jgi:hypothetical protein
MRYPVARNTVSLIPVEKKELHVLKMIQPREKKEKKRPENNSANKRFHFFQSSDKTTMTATTISQGSRI